ncbi:MAG TPA: YraN family protein [Chloroflexota bacterium]|nr:YraN family protein [Chloroflexota bacterium]
MDRRRETGANGEQRAVDYLTRQGYTIVERNWRTSFGELDIVAREKQELVLVEVRTLEAPHVGFPEESVGAHKQRQLAKLATAYVQQAKHAGDWRVDVIAIDRDGIRHIKNAVSLW